MIKYGIDKGNLTELEIRGNISELVADIACLYQTIYERFLEELGQDGADYFGECVRHTLDRADELSKKEATTDKGTMLAMLLKAIFTGKNIDEVAKEMAKKSYAEAEGLDESDKNDQNKE